MPSQSIKVSSLRSLVLPSCRSRCDRDPSWLCTAAVSCAPALCDLPSPVTVKRLRLSGRKFRLLLPAQESHDDVIIVVVRKKVMAENDKLKNC